MSDVIKFPTRESKLADAYTSLLKWQNAAVADVINHRPMKRFLEGHGIETRDQ